MVEVGGRGRRVWALPYSGVPALLSNVSIVSFGAAVLLALLRSPVQAVFIALGFLTALLSLGDGVEVRGGAIVLRYGFPVTVFRLELSDVVSVFNVNELRRGKLVKYFKSQLMPFILIVLLPPLYTLVCGKPANPAYIPWIILPSLLGLLLMLYFTFTAKTYRELLRRISGAVCTSLALLGFVISVMYRQSYGSSIFSDVPSLLMALVGLTLLGAFSAILAILAGKRPIIVLEDSEGKFYAVGAIDGEAASSFIKLVLREVVSRVEAST
ncbi:MAG: hypothetical protein DRK00_07200 [Thermoprotei archaeon]|nr:MAG: hypothetical protein DRK00_07200 [Thermoprotei archaeon]